MPLAPPDREKAEKDLMKLPKKTLIDGLKVVKFKGISAKLNKKELVKRMLDGMEEGYFKHYEEEKTIKLIREALGLSTHGNIKDRTQGLRKSKIDDSKTPKQLASESLALVKQALAMTDRKPKLKKQFISRIRKELDDFEEELKNL